MKKLMLLVSLFLLTVTLASAQAPGGRWVCEFVEICNYNVPVWQYPCHDELQCHYYDGPVCMPGTPQTTLIIPPVDSTIYVPGSPVIVSPNLSSKPGQSAMPKNQPTVPRKKGDFTTTTVA